MTLVSANLRRGLIAAAATLATAGVVAGPAPTSAAACKYEFPSGTFVLNQSNGFRVEFPASGGNATGKAISYNNRQEAADAGDVTAAINNNSVTFTIQWSSNLIGQYDGTVRADGTVAGQTKNMHNGDTASWESVTALKCVEQAPPPAPNPQPKPADTPAEPAGATVEVNSDVDVYDTPGGDGNIIGALDGHQDDGAGDRVPFFACRDDGWCEIGFAAGPNGRGWVWGEHIDHQAF